MFFRRSSLLSSPSMEGFTNTNIRHYPCFKIYVSDLANDLAFFQKLAIKFRSNSQIVIITPYQGFKRVYITFKCATIHIFLNNFRQHYY